MPYVIGAVVILVGLIAFFALRSPAEAPAVTEPASQTEVAPADTQEGDADATLETEVDLETAAAAETKPADTDVGAADNEQTFTADASYFTPKRTEHEILVSLTLKDSIVTDADVSYDGGAAVTPSHSAFDATYRSEVVGKPLNEINLSRVGGASLTSTAFNEAVADIRAQI